MQYSLIRFLKNLKYLSRFDLKTMHRENQEALALLKNLPEKIRDEIKNDFENIKPPKIKNNFETLEELLKTNKSFIRFGDGEYILMEGGDIGFQKYDKNLAKSLKEILLSCEEDLLIGIGYEYFHIPLHCRKYVREFLYTWGLKHYDRMKKYILDSKTYGSTNISQVYATYEQYDFKAHYTMLKRIFVDKKIVVVCGEKVFSKIRYNLFEEFQEVEYIYGPTKNAYGDLPSLKAKLLKRSKEEILVFALGPAGKVLAYEMFLEGYRSLDLGHSIKDYDSYKRDILMNKENIKAFFAPDE